MKKELDNQVSLETAYKNAAYLLEKGEFDLAEKQLSEILKKYPDDEEIQQKNIEINEAYIVLNRELNPDFEEEDENWIINFFKKDRRSNWSDEEGYVPYTKRERIESTPDTQKNKEKYPYIEE